MNDARIQEFETAVKRCCGLSVTAEDKGWCESFGCSDVLELLQYIKHLEDLLCMAQVLHKDEDVERFEKQIEEGLKNPTELVPTPRIDEALKLIRKDLKYKKEKSK